MIADILVETAEGYLEGRLVRMISVRVPVFTNLYQVVPGRFIDNLCEIEGIKLRL